MGYTDPPPRKPVDDNDGWPTVRSLFGRGAEKLKRANYRRTGAVTGSIAAVALVSLGTTLSANATTSSSEVYARQFTASPVDDRETQSLQVSATSEGPALIHRTDGIYKPDMIWPTVGGAGVAISSGFGYRPALGWEVLVQDEGNRQYVYGHMVADSTPADVVPGAKVAQGQVIGLVGSTGLSTGAHLHFEILEDGVQIDPYPELLKYAR
jgi:murein DD-endopeptidase MepM/ murein hydrolase activator NlpD